MITVNIDVEENIIYVHEKDKFEFRAWMFREGNEQYQYEYLPDL